VGVPNGLWLSDSLQSWLIAVTGSSSAAHHMLCGEPVAGVPTMSVRDTCAHGLRVCHPCRGRWWRRRWWRICSVEEGLCSDLHQAPAQSAGQSPLASRLLGRSPGVQCCKNRAVLWGQRFTLSYNYGSRGSP